MPAAGAVLVAGAESAWDPALAAPEVTAAKSSPIFVPPRPFVPAHQGCFALYFALNFCPMLLDCFLLSPVHQYQHS
jgi:hypothetical protein